jgi:hypothetical protein
MAGFEAELEESTGHLDLEELGYSGLVGHSQRKRAGLELGLPTLVGLVLEPLTLAGLEPEQRKLVDLERSKQEGCFAVAFSGSPELSQNHLEHYGQHSQLGPDFVEVL